MSYYYDPLNPKCKSCRGGVSRGSEITFHILKTGGEEFFSATACYFVFYKDGEVAREIAMEKRDGGFILTLRFNQIGLYFYHFRLVGSPSARGDASIHFLGCGELRRGRLGDTPVSWQITVYEADYETPEWMKGGIMYQIFPDRFHKSGDGKLASDKILRKDWGGIPCYKPNSYGKILNNDFFGGNLNGIREKLDYLKRLNVSVIYLNPIFEAYSNHRYDTGDYMKIDPLLGTEEDFDALISAAKERGMHVILDGVFNHTGDDSRYFNKYGKYQSELGAHQSPYSKYSDWYHFKHFPDSYDCWWGIDTLPAVNERSPSYQEFIFGENGVLRHWLKHGIDGYRLDVADELPDFFLQKLRTAVKSENKDAIVLGEVWEDASNKIAYSERRQYLLGHELDSVMNYPLKDAIINFVFSANTAMLRETIAMLIDNYPKQTLDCLMNVLGTHDTPRILTVLGGKYYENKDDMAKAELTHGEKTEAIRKLKMAAFLLYTLPGVPCIYYGDETGMQGFQDPFCRRCFPWDNQNEELLSFYRKLGEIRSEMLAGVFAEGVYREVFADRFCLVFERRTEECTVYVYVNNSHGKYTMKTDETLYEYLSGRTYRKTLELDAYSYGILVKM